jgi:hypothetical protein
VAHISFVCLEIDRFAASFADDFAEIEISINLMFDAIDFGGAISGGGEFVGDVGVGANIADDSARAWDRKITNSV